MHAPLPAVLALAALSAAFAASPAPQDRGEEVAAHYRKAAGSGDHAALVALWQQHPDLVLVTIDADLEGSLSLREAGGAPREEEIAALHARALAGARAAEEATGHPILTDYASAFIGWDADEQARFRAGQAAFGRARAAAREGDHETALAAARECIELAAPLGDWWGTAMGHAAEGRALLALGRPEEALVALSRARMIHRDLGLRSSEYGDLRALVEALTALGRDVRRREVARQAIDLGRALGDEEGVARLAALLDADADAER